MYLPDPVHSNILLEPRAIARARVISVEVEIEVEKIFLSFDMPPSAAIIGRLPILVPEDLCCKIPAKTRLPISDSRYN